MQSLSGHCLIRQQVSVELSLNLVYLNTGPCISEKNKVGFMLAQGFLRVESQAKITKCYFFVSWGNKFVIIEWPPFDAPTSTYGVFTSFSLSIYLAYISVEISLCLCWRRDILRIKGQVLFTYCNFSDFL